jgi:nucleoside permease NupC
MKTKNWERSKPAPFWEYVAISIDTFMYRKVVRLVSRGILAGLIGVGCIDYLPTIFAIGRIVLARLNILIVIMQYLLTTNDVVLAEIYTLICNANSQSAAALEGYELIVSRD